MQKSLILVVLSLAITSCQSFRSKDDPSQGIRREIANTNLLKRFIDDIARQTQNSARSYTSKQIERKVLEYIKRKEKDVAFGNWSKMGIMDDQVKHINGLYDDLPYMKKIHDWVSENITRIIKIETSIAESAYALMMRKSTSTINPYKVRVADANDMMMRRRDASSPLFESTAIKENLIKSKIRGIKNRKIRKVYQQNYLKVSKRADMTPSLKANYQVIFDSASDVEKLTGHSFMGQNGCHGMSPSVIAFKADIDLYAKNFLKEKAFKKAGRKFASVDDITATQRLTRAEVDEGLQEGFKRVLNYTDEEARIAVRRLKNKPCKVY
jgi:hypothetical protein